MTAPVISLVGRWGGKLRNQNVETMSGDDVILEVTVVNLDGTAKDITGATILWKLSTLPGLEEKIVKTGSITDATNGVLQIAVDSTGPLAGVHYHEAEMTESGGAVGTIMRGRMTVERDTVNAS